MYVIGRTWNTRQKSLRSDRNSPAGTLCKFKIRIGLLFYRCVFNFFYSLQEILEGTKSYKVRRGYCGYQNFFIFISSLLILPDWPFKWDFEKMAWGKLYRCTLYWGKFYPLVSRRRYLLARPSDGHGYNVIFYIYSTPKIRTSCRYTKIKSGEHFKGGLEKTRFFSNFCNSEKHFVWKKRKILRMYT